MEGDQLRFLRHSWLDPSFAQRLDTTSPRGLPRSSRPLSHCEFRKKPDRQPQSLRADFGGVFGNGTLGLLVSVRRHCWSLWSLSSVSIRKRISAAIV